MSMVFLLVYGGVAVGGTPRVVRIDVQQVGTPNGTRQGAESWCTTACSNFVRIDQSVGGRYDVRTVYGLTVAYRLGGRSTVYGGVAGPRS